MRRRQPGPMLARSLASQDFRRARRKAFWRALGLWLVRGDNALLAFDEIRRRLRADTQHEVGPRAVPIDRIVGSVGRYRDFDAAFLPRQVRTRGKWESVDSAQILGIELPPIELYQIGDVYFVKDGNHRVSVARERGQVFIDANVIVVETPAPVSSIEDVLDWLRDEDAVAFYAATKLARLRPSARVELTLPGQYEKLLEHIATHRWYLGIEERREVGWEDAVQSWYDRVYVPTVEAVRRTGVLRDFPHRTEADLYLWITEHHWYLHQSGLPRGHGLDSLVSGYAAEHGTAPLRRIRRALPGASARRGDADPGTERQ